MTNEEFQKIVLDKLNNVENKIDNVESNIARIEKKLDVVHDQTANLTEFRTETNIKFDKVLDEVQCIRKDLSTVEIVTATNYADIAKLKAVK